MPKYLIKVNYTLEGKPAREIVDVESKTVKKAKQDAANVIYNKLKGNKRKYFRVINIDHVRFRLN